jgi:hypothetical protein
MDSYKYLCFNLELQHVQSKRYKQINQNKIIRHLKLQY